MDIAQNANFGSTWPVNGTKIHKFDSIKFRYYPIVLYAIIKFSLATEMAKEIDCENGDSRKLKSSVTRVRCRAS